MGNYVWLERDCFDENSPFLITLQGVPISAFKLWEQTVLFKKGIISNGSKKITIKIVGNMIWSDLKRCSFV